MDKPKRELLCQECGREYPVWYTENSLWNLLTYITKETIQYLCPTCFMVLLEKKTKNRLYWKVSIPEN